MRNIVRLLVATGPAAAAILVVAIGMAKDTAALMAPANLILFVVAAAPRLLPTATAVSVCIPCFNILECHRAATAEETL